MYVCMYVCTYARTYEMIFCLKTSADDFIHLSTKFYAIFVDVSDALCSLDQVHVIKTLLESVIEKNTVY